MKRYGKQFWRSVPFIRLLFPLTAGILLTHYTGLSLLPVSMAAMAAVIMLIVFRLISTTKKYRYRWINGLAFNILMACTGATILYFQDLTNDPGWIGHYLRDKEIIFVTLQETPVQKTNSFKAVAVAENILVNNTGIPVRGRVLLYFSKDSSVNGLQSGSQLIIKKPWQPITNSGNPGGFDYKQYCAFQDIYHQVYLQRADYRVLPGRHMNGFSDWLTSTRNKTLYILKKYIPGKKESGVAEALLIGYRDDLDKDLVRAYSNTGVVHIIAISGLHLGMIYGLLLLVLTPLRRIKWMFWAKPLIILAMLWGFSLLSGAAASILRSAVMFSFIVVGESLGRRTNMYNTLAASAFLLLLYNPYFLWDVGFQLSYTAVLSIVLFMKPVYKWIFFQNKLLNAIWKLNSITISAQVFTLPIILYYFHQFPNLFLFTNFIAVPLSGFILYGELLLLIVSPFQWLAVLNGKTTAFLISQMNGFIERTDRLPYAVTGDLQLSLYQTLFLYAAIACLAWWLIQKKTGGLLAGLGFLCCFTILASLTVVVNILQQKLIVYNIPKHSGIDIIEGRNYQCIADSALLQNTGLQQFHLQPSRVLNGVKEAEILENTFIKGGLIATNHKTILVITGPVNLPVLHDRIPVDIIILSGNPKLWLSRLAAVFDCGQYVFDSSNPLWKIQYWKKDADSLHLRHHSTPEQGAFEVAL